MKIVEFLWILSPVCFIINTLQYCENTMVQYSTQKLIVTFVIINKITSLRFH